MAGRGRRAGYNNYTVQDQLLLYGGENDAAFEAEVDEATAQRTLRGRGAGPAPATGAAIDTGIQPGALDDADSDADTVESGDEFDAADVVAAEGGGEDFPATTQARGGDEISQYAQRTTRDVAPTPDTQSVGSILTRSGVIDVNLAADFNLSTEEASEDDGCASNTTPALLQTPTPSAETPASRIDDNSSHSYIRVDSIEASDTNPRQSSQRTLRREAIPTTATPDGPMLHRDANREELDTRETDENQNLNVASNRLGGQDLRVFRDNIAVMTQNMLNANGEASSC
ncbi:hypothetical protein PF008_g26091 [Phytophthora fragariae]|uniref:Uncharacterized protein n=1 Tax=Phytophthora fragariae TaxID=53985 RepID=A0A6G0QIT2_9STRA|nr:hypothetical protein PF008_g26091 [Phytophthora fragariae]